MGFQPGRGWTVAAFAAYPFQIELPYLLLGRHRERMTSQAFGRSCGVADSQDPSHTLRDRVIEAVKGFEVGVFGHPGAVLILQNKSEGAWLYATVARASAAGSRANVFSRWHRRRLFLRPSLGPGDVG